MTAIRRADIIDLRMKEGISRVHRRLFSDPELFDLEMRHLFEGGWVFVALESQLPRPHDFLTTTIGRQSILVMRDGKGALGAFYNTCPHRGARICSLRTGNSRVHVCPYHSWSFDSAGKSRAIKGKSEGRYSDAFLNQDHGLHSVARFASYRGILFASLNADVPSLEDYLGDARVALDLILDQSEHGIELLPGSVSYTFRANWKQQLENASDSYHVTSTHPTYFRVAEQRAAEQAEGDGVEGIWDRFKMITEAHSEGSRSGSFGFENGHALVWAAAPVVPGHALFEKRDELERRCGPVRRDWMFYPRNLTIFPNVQFAENFSSQLRIIRPIAPGLTEMQTFCLAPKGESAAARSLRLRQYEDFFNPTGMANPDDNVVYEDCQDGHSIEGEAGWLQGYARGLMASLSGGGRAGAEIGINPVQSVEGSTQLSDETVFQNYYRAWGERLMPIIEARTVAAGAEIGS